MKLEADYVIVGAGAVGMAFADTLLTDTNATMVVVDRRLQPGGHWNDAYPFVRLHAPAALYGVNSSALGSGRKDRAGLNKGLQELSSRAEILDYYDRVMRERLLPSGRVTYLPASDYQSGGEVVSLVDGTRRHVHARRKIVDATYADTRLPATHAPTFEVATGVTCIPPGELVHLRERPKGLVIIGGGKTAMDTATWLLEQGVDPAAITWIRPREAWLLNRANVQTDLESFERTIGSLAAELEAAMAATSLDDLFAKLEAGGLLRRIDRSVTPTMYRCAIVSDAELSQMRRITRVVRLGHVNAIRSDLIVLEQGVMPTSPDQVHIHCTADGIPARPSQPVFQPGRLVLQYVRRCSPTFSAAFLARLEATIADDAQKNALAGLVPVPNVPLDWLRMLVQDAENALRWSQLPELRKWCSQARLNAISVMAEQAMTTPTPVRTEIMGRYRRAMGPAVTRLRELLAEASIEATALEAA